MYNNINAKKDKKMARPIILITPNYTSEPFPTMMVRYTYVNAVRAAGGIPLTVPYCDEKEMEEYLKIADGIIFTGGGDILSSIYGEEELVQPVNYSKERDDFDLTFFKKAFATELPIIAICRGIQVANVALGGTLWQDIPSQCDAKCAHRQTEARGVLTHSVKVTPDSLIREIAGCDTFGVNTFHHQSIKDIAPTLKVTAYSEDGIIEAAEATDREAFFLGTQWHPEDLCKYEWHFKIFERLVSEAKIRKENKILKNN